MEFLGMDMLRAIVEEVQVPEPRVRNLPPMQNVVSVFVVVAVYLMFFLKWGPKRIEKRTPFELQKTLLIYNAVSLGFSVWMTYKTLASGWWNENSLRYQHGDYSDNPKAMRIALLSHVYFICKLVELLDTVFFVLNRKDNQVTFLHLYHQSAMLVLTFYTAQLAPGGYTSFGVLLNWLVHSIMSSYYLLAGLSPQYHKYLWWKSHLSKLI